MRRPQIPALAIAGLLVLAACGDGSGESVAGDGATTVAVTEAPTSPAEPVTSAPADPGGTPTTAATVTAPADTAPGTTAAAVTVPAVAVPPILDLTVETVSDGPLSLAAYAGKPVALWFWAPG